MSGTLAIVHAPGVNQAQLNTLVEKLRDFIDHMDFKGADIQVNPDIHLKSEKYDNKDEIITLIVGWGLPFKPTQGWWMNEIPISKTVRQFIAIDLFERNRFDGRELNPPKINAGKYWSRKTRRENFRLFLEGFYIKPTAPYAMRRVPTKKSKKTGRSLYAFMRFLADEGVMSPELLKRKIHIKLPIKLPKSIEPDDEDRILAKIDKVRDKALILLLLRTGMRIGELLKTTMQDISLEEQLIRIYESEKTGTGRVVYFSNDAAEALYQWLMKRDYWKKYLFHGPRDKAISYEAARTIFKKYVDKAGLSHKGITLHCLRHTYATRLLNAGMRIEVLRDLLGHHNLEQTRRYANLTDNTRKAQYFKTMAIIEGRKNK